MIDCPACSASQLTPQGDAYRCSACLLSLTVDEARGSYGAVFTSRMIEQPPARVSLYNERRDAMAHASRVIAAAGLPVAYRTPSPLSLLDCEAGDVWVNVRWESSRRQFAVIVE